MSDQSLSPQIQISFHDQSFSAGSTSFAAVKLRNPHKVPIEIINIKASAPDMQHYKGNGEVSGNGKAESIIGKAGESMSNALVSTSFSFLGMSASIATTQSQLNIAADKNSTIKIPPYLQRFDKINIDAEEGALVEFAAADNIPDLDQSVARSDMIGAESEKIIPLQFIVRKWLFFRPRRMQWLIEVNYRIQNTERSQVNTIEFSVNPPLISIIIGSVLGGILGSVGRDLSNGVTMLGPISLRALTAVILSIIGAVMLARKGAAQSFITVEDFFGAFIVGSLVGYQGPEYFQDVIAGGFSAGE